MSAIKGGNTEHISACKKLRKTSAGEEEQGSHRYTLSKANDEASKWKTNFNFLLPSVKAQGLQTGKCKIKANMKEMSQRGINELEVSSWKEERAVPYNTPN